MNKPWLTLILTNVALIVFCTGLFQLPLKAQNNDSDDIEVYLDFRHRGIINSMVISYYKDDEFYLPVMEVFSLFKIDHSATGLLIKGRFSTEQVPYRIDFESNIITYGDQVYHITQDDYLIKELDFYLKPEVFDEVFGLHFSIDFNNLTLRLETDRELPIVQKSLRELRRVKADANRYSQKKYDLRHDRSRPFLDIGFLDYNLSASVNEDINVYNYNANVGLQFLGGDIQGSLYGSSSNRFTTFSTDNLRWRYMYRDQPWLSRILIGQSTTDGITQNRYTGIRLSNEPIEPRRLFDEFEVQGTTIPEAEVELYLNNMLIDFNQADELGNYRFLMPVSYGSSQLDLRIYGPTGQVIERSDRIQVPFVFQPKGEFNYTLNVGQLDNPIIGSAERPLTAQANGAFGLTKWLTARAGVEYYDQYHDDIPTFTTAISGRILNKYIVSFEGATDAYYRAALNAIYPNSASINVDYTNFTSGFGIYNPSNDDQRIIASAFYPFSVFGLPLNIRASTFTRMRESIHTTSFRVDANSRLGKLNLRVGYSDRINELKEILEPRPTAYMESSATYSISRSRSLPSYLRGTFIRAQMRYYPAVSQVESAELLISQNVFKKGRFQLSFGRNFLNGFNTLRFNLIVDFDKIRTGTTVNTVRNNPSFTQNIRGSVGYDTNYGNLLFSSRDQVGRSGAAIKLFVDNNTNNTFDQGDDTIHENAIRIDQSGSSSISKNGILYYTQMHPYYYYNMELNKSAVKNPLLVPEIEKFGVITDPNRFKKIEIPFYMSGVIEGIVERRHTGGQTSGVAGLKLMLTGKSGDFTQEIRTFSDGSFYAYEVPPGDYELRIDSSQVKLLKSIASPAVRTFTVKAIPEGDFVERLTYLLEPAESQSSPDEQRFIARAGLTRTSNSGGGLSIEYHIGVDDLQQGECSYEVQLGSFSTLENAKSAIQRFPHLSDASIVFNQNGGLYGLRKGTYSSLNEASKAVNNIYDIHYFDAAVVNKCEEIRVVSTVPPAGNYRLQLAAFSNPNRAETYITTLKRKFGIEAVRIQDEQSRLHKIKTGPYISREEALDARDKIAVVTALTDIYIIKEKETEVVATPSINTEYNFRIELGEFDDTRSATLYALRIEEEFGLPSKIIIDESDNVLLVLEEVYTSWKPALQIRNQIFANKTFRPPLIHLLERGL